MDTLDALDDAMTSILKNIFDLTLGQLGTKKVNGRLQPRSQFEF